MSLHPSSSLWPFASATENKDMFFHSTNTPHLKGPSLKVLFDVKPVCGTKNNEGCCSEQPTESGVVDVRVHVTGNHWVPRTQQQFVTLINSCWNSFFPPGLNTPHSTIVMGEFSMCCFDRLLTQQVGVGTGDWGFDKISSKYVSPELSWSMNNFV